MPIAQVVSNFHSWPDQRCDNWIWNPGVVRIRFTAAAGRAVWLTAGLLAFLVLLWLLLFTFSTFRLSRILIIIILLCCLKQFLYHSVNPFFHPLAVPAQKLSQLLQGCDNGSYDLEAGGSKPKFNDSANCFLWSISHTINDRSISYFYKYIAN